MTAHTFDEAEHPRRGQGKFATKQNSAPAGKLAQSAGNADSDETRVDEVAKTLRPTPGDRNGTARARVIVADEKRASAGWAARGAGVIGREAQQAAEAVRADIVGVAQDIFD